MIDQPPAPVETLVVRAARLAPSPADPVFAVTRLEPKPGERIDEALRQVPGASLFRRTSSLAANPTTQGVSLRAIAPSGAGRALVTLDGVPQNDPFGGWVIWTALPPEGLEGVSIVRGAGAGPYGAGALTGVVALEEEAARPFTADVAVGDHGYGRAAGAVGLGPLTFTGALERGDGYIPVRGPRAGAADTPADLQAWTGAVRAQGEALGAVAALRLGAYREERGAGLAGARSVASGTHASFTLAQPQDGWRLQVWVRESDLENTSVAVAAGRTGTTAANEQYATPALGWGFNAALRRSPRPGLTWEAGFDARLADGEVRERFRNLGAGFTRNRVAGGETAVAGLYAEAVMDRGPWLVAGGLRADAWSNAGALRRETDMAGAVTLEERPADREGVLPTARLGVRRTLSPDLWLRAAAYAGFRPPTLNELHRPFRVGNDITEANAALEPERLYGLEAGAGGEGAWRWRASGFFNRLADPVTNVTIGEGPGTFPRVGVVPTGGVLRERRNAGRIDAFGLEAEAERDFAGGLSVRTAAGYTHARVEGGKRPAQTPELTVTAGADWQGERWSLSAALRYEGPRFEDDLNSRELAAAVTLDARAGWRIGEGAELYLAADNLLDARIEAGETGDGVESLGSPRMLRIGVSLRR